MGNSLSSSDWSHVDSPKCETSWVITTVDKVPDEFPYGKSKLDRIIYMMGVLNAVKITEPKNFEKYAEEYMVLFSESPIWTHFQHVMAFMNVCEGWTIDTSSLYLDFLLRKIKEKDPGFFLENENRVRTISLLEKYTGKWDGKKQKCLVGLLEIVDSFGPNEDKIDADADAVQPGAACTDADAVQHDVV